MNILALIGLFVSFINSTRAKHDFFQVRYTRTIAHYPTLRHGNGIACPWNFICFLRVRVFCAPRDIMRQLMLSAVEVRSLGLVQAIIIISNVEYSQRFIRF